MSISTESTAILLRTNHNRPRSRSAGAMEASYDPATRMMTITASENSHRPAGTTVLWQRPHEPWEPRPMDLQTHDGVHATHHWPPLWIRIDE